MNTILRSKDKTGQIPKTTLYLIVLVCWGVEGRGGVILFLLNIFMNYHIKMLCDKIVYKLCKPPLCGGLFEIRGSYLFL